VIHFTIDGVWIDDRIYWTPWYSAWLHFTVYCYIHTGVQSHVFTSRCLVAASNSGRFPSSGFPNFLRPHPLAFNSNSSQQVSPTSYLTNTLTDSLNSTELSHSKSVLLITSRHGPHRKYRSSVVCLTAGLHATVSVPLCPPLLSHKRKIECWRCLRPFSYCSIFTKNLQRK
jgi:hypothetical protein